MKPKQKTEVAFTDVRQNLTAIVDQVQKSGKAVTILRHGKPAAVIISHQVYKQEIEKAKPFRLAGSMKVAPGIDVDAVLAKAKQERIRLWEERGRRLKKELK